MISVIIPVYNAEKYIERCLDSVLAQTYQDFEIIIVNDDSDDGTIKKCTEYFNSDYRIYCETIKHSGVGVARNHGMDISKGNLIFFLDADDYITPDALECLYKGWTKNECPIVIGGIDKINPQGQRCAMPLPWSKEVVLNKNDIDDCVFQYLKTHYAYLVSHCWGRLYERDFLECYGIRFPEGVKVGEDGAFNVKCLTHTDSVMVINTPLYCFQIHSNSSSVVAIKNKEMDLRSFQDGLNYYFKKRIEAFIGNLTRVTNEWGKRNE